MAKTLIVRYAQIGDVLIAVPVIYSLAKQYPEDEFTVLTNTKFSGIFRQMPSNVKLYPMIYRRKKIALRGLIYLFERYTLLLKLFFSKKYDRVALLQDGTFEDQLQCLLSIRKSRVVRIDLKEFLSKEKLKQQDFLQTPPLHKLYAETLSQLGYLSIENEFDASWYKDQSRQNILLNNNQMSVSAKRVGIAPFSRLKLKVYPLEKIEEIIRYFHSRPDVELLIFGGGEEEKLKTEEWKKRYPRIQSVIGKMTFDEEMLVVASCRVLLTMDSANLHLASLVGTPAVSIWGPSHPRLGYYPYNQDEDNAIQKEIACRPCSFWGENPCINEQKCECMNIDPQVIVQKIESFLNQ